jgi:putative hydrolase of the HAD superfamily
MNRAQLPDEVFGIPQERKYPMPDKRHTISAIKLFNHVEDKYEEQLAKAIIKNMKKYNIDSSMVGENNRLKKYLPKDMISEASTGNFTFLDISSNKQKSLSYFNSVGKNYDKNIIDLYVGEIIVDKNTDKVVGSVLVGNKKDKGFITDLWVDKKYQGSGLGNILIKDAIHKYNGIDLTVRKDNDVAIHLYKKYGFVSIEYNNKEHYWMKLKSKLSAEDKVLKESYLLEDTAKIKNVIFDLGNVLVSTNMEDQLALDPDIPNDKIPYIMSQWYKDEDGTIELEEFKKIIPDRLKELSKFIPRLFEYNVRCVNSFNYTIPLIDNLIKNGYDVYFLSNWSKWSYDLLAKHHKFDFLKKMNGGLWSWQAGCMKPDIKIYEMLLKKYNLNPEECAFFDDLIDNVSAARSLGIRSLKFDRFNPDNLALDAKLNTSLDMIKEFGTTAGTVVGSNQADSIYIVNYMQNNVFSGHKENRLGICKKGMKDLHTFGGRYNKFHYVSDLEEFKKEASDIKMYRYTGTPKNSFYEIIEDTVNDLDLYKLLTGRDLPDRSFIDYDSEFIQEECFLDTLDAIRECTEAGLLSLTENKYPVPILTETVQGRPYNYYRDLDGVFIQHEVTKIRSKSYRDKNSIPEAQVNAVKRGYLY